MKKPNFFIVGAPKCGTTSLAHWLAQHPNIFMSPMKEPHHFSTDFPLDTWRNPVDYNLLFQAAENHHKAVGEASVWYLRSHEAIPRIETELPNSRYIVLLRNPAEMAPSLHWQTIFNGDEDIDDFQMAWRLDKAREKGERIPTQCRDAKLVQYRLACNLGAQMARLYDIVEIERILPVFLEDVMEDVHAEWARILEFLEVPHWGDLDFHPQNNAKHWRWPWVRDCQRLYSKTRRRLALPPLGWGVFKRLNKVAVKESDRKPLSNELRQELVKTFSDDIDLLAELTGRDLSHWKQT